ncbi:MAG: ankyrin repeat domain-containing protein [Acidobacteria bacterium]|nr:ankyrin repeat domain-containing protein [Acidobacteriota bacterium]
MMRLRSLPGLWLMSLLSAASLGADSGPAQLADAVQHRDRQAVLSLLETQADVNAPQNDGATALHWAAYLEDAETTALLIRAGARVDVANAYGITPVALAASNGNAAILHQLLEAKADPELAVRSGETPLMLAARAGKVDAVNVLLEAGADINATETWNGQTPLMWAAAAGHGPVVRTLIDHQADITIRSGSGADALLFAARYGDIGSVRALLAAGADVNGKRPDGATPLLVAVINGHEDLVDFLLDKGADPNAEGGSIDITLQGVRAQAKEVEFKKPTIQEQLKSVSSEGGGGRANIFGKPLQAAVHVANWHISDHLIVVKLDRLRVIKSLLAHGAEVNGRNTFMEPRWAGARYRRELVGATALLFAAKAADVEVMRLLLEHGADPRINTDLNITPLMAAAGISWASNQDRASEAQVLEAVRLLVEEQHLEVNFANDLGETAMHAAAYRGANNIVHYLFDKGAKLDVMAKDGRTPLIAAEGVEYGNSFAAQPQTAELLLQLGAKKQECPWPCQAPFSEEAIAEILKAKGIEIEAEVPQ